ncbi:PREDICTED: probable phosphoribosylformylglycinamidine synthase, partial [Vollenhovia emeryi]|uniref:probable phosphoribosylformylglycinamidine synthase n=1 Tax=Vollenhovia emeryi TaxID=411798 RepID=UPI0005F56F95
FASVQRANAEMERRCQEVIDRCWQKGEDNPIITIHDIGAGGYCVALSEFVHDSNLGGKFELRDIPNADMSMSPMEIWCNEAQERYVLGIDESNLAELEAMCERERCPFAVVGEAIAEPQLIVTDRLLKETPIDIPMSTLFGKPPKMTREVATVNPAFPALELENITIAEAARRVLQLPAVASKKFLITIGDRNVGGLITRDQMVGPWQVPVSDVAVAASSFKNNFGEAMAMGERAPVASINSPASARIAIGETITNLLAADIEKLSDIKLSANWMAASGDPLENQRLFETVKAVGEEFCPALNLTIPVGKDSLSMSTSWKENGKSKTITSPLSLISTGFAPVKDVRKTLTPELQLNGKPTSLILIDLGKGKNRLGGSALAQTYGQLGNESPDIDPETLGT